MSVSSTLVSIKFAFYTSIIVLSLCYHLTDMSSLQDRISLFYLLCSQARVLHDHSVSFKLSCYVSIHWWILWSKIASQLHRLLSRNVKSLIVLSLYTSSPIDESLLVSIPLRYLFTWLTVSPYPVVVQSNVTLLARLLLLPTLILLLLLLFMIPFDTDR